MPGCRSDLRPPPPQGSQRWLRGVGTAQSRRLAGTGVGGGAPTWRAAYQRTFPDRGKGLALTLQPLDEAFFGGMRQPLVLLQTAVGLVLLISCANLAALILTRAVSRQRELAVARRSARAGRASSGN